MKLKTVKKADAERDLLISMLFAFHTTNRDQAKDILRHLTSGANLVHLKNFIDEIWMNEKEYWDYVDEDKK